MKITIDVTDLEYQHIAFGGCYKNCNTWADIEYRMFKAIQTAKKTG